MTSLCVKKNITPYDHEIEKGYWSVDYNTKEVRDFLQSQGLKDQDNHMLAKALLAGLLPEIFGSVFANGAVPKSGYPAHDGTIRDNSRKGVVVVYEHDQGWDHYKTDPVKDGLGGASFTVKLKGTEKLYIPQVFGLEQLARTIFGDQLPKVIKADKRYNPHNSHHRFNVGTFGYSYDNYGQEMDESNPYLTMAPRDPRYENISQVSELFLKVIGTIKNLEPQFKLYAGLVNQREVALGLPAFINAAFNNLEIAFHEINTDSRQAARVNLANVLGFVNKNLSDILTHVDKRKEELTSKFGEAFAPIRQELADYFTQPLYSSKEK